MERVGNQLLVRPAAIGTVWDALTGGTQLTDLTTLTGTPITQVTADADGAVYFMGPDGATHLYVDFGYTKRFALAAVDTGEVLTDFMAQGGEPGGWAVLDGAGNIDPSQIPAQLDWLNVQSYGAIGDGTHNDTTNIQAAIDACDEGGIVYLPRGIYKTTATLDLKSGVTLLGSHSNMMLGPGMTNDDFPCYIQPVTPFTGTSVIQIIGDDDGTHPDISGEQRILNLMFDGSLLTGSSIDGLFAKGNVQNVVLDNVCIRQMPNNGMVTADRTDGTFPYSWRLHHVMVDNCHANGILFTGNTDLTLDDVQVIGCWAQGIVLTNCTNTQAVMCRAEWNGSHGFHITGAWGDWQGSGGMLMGDCTTDRNGQHGVFIDATGNTPISLSNINTRRDGRNGGAGGGNYAGLAVIGATVPVIIDGLTCYPGVDDAGGSTNSPQYGVRLSGSTTVTIDSAYLHANTAGYLDDGTNTSVSLGANITTVAGATTVTARTLVNPYRAAPGAKYVASASAPAREKARADYVCDGTADQVQIQAAVDAAKAEGGGIVQLSGGTFNLAGTVTISGNADEDNADTVTLCGIGAQATTLSMASNTNGIELTNWAMANIEDLGIVVAGSGSCIHSTAVLSGNEVSFWHSSFRNLRLNGGFTTTNTGWGMDLAMPWRSAFENIEIEGTRNGMRLSNQGSVQNAGDCTFTRMFIEIVGTGGSAIHVTGTGNNMNQNNFNMVEIGANGSGCTGILIDGTDPVSSQRFWGLNAEQFQTTINVAKGDSCVFDCNYVTGDSGDAANKMFVCADGSYNNTFSAKKVNINSAGTLKIIEDNNDTSNAPNVFQAIRIENNATGTVTYTKRTNTVLRDITTFNSGNAMPDGLLQYPLSTVNNAAFTPADHGLVAWTHDPASLRSTSNATTSGTVYLCKVKVVNRSTVVTNVIVGIEGAGVTLTAGQSFVGLYNSSGTLLSASADQSGNWTSTGLKTIALSAAQTLAVGTYYVAILSVGTTPPTFAMGAGGATTVSAGLATSAARFLTGPTAQTSLPASITLASQTVTSGARWAALS